MSAHDFNWPAIMNHFHALFSWQEMVDAQWQVGLRTTHGILFSARFRQMRQALSRQRSDTGLLVSRSVSGDGVCTIDLPRKSARHRNLFEIGPAETLSHGISRSHCTQHTGRRQPQTRLAHLRRICTNPHPARENFIATSRSESIWKRRSMLSIRRPSICVSRCFPGPRFDAGREPSSFTRCSIYAAISPVFFAFRTEKCTT